MNTECSQKLLRIELSRRTASEETIPAEVLRRYVGGTGIGVKYSLGYDPALRRYTKLYQTNVISVRLAA